MENSHWVIQGITSSGQQARECKTRTHPLGNITHWISKSSFLACYQLVFLLGLMDGAFARFIPILFSRTQVDRKRYYRHGMTIAVEGCCILKRITLVQEVK